MTMSCAMRSTIRRDRIGSAHTLFYSEIADRLQLGSDVCAANEAGRLAEELVPVLKPQPSGAKPGAQTVSGKGAAKGGAGDVLLAVDEHPRPEVSLEKIAKLPTVFRKETGGRRATVTAANASVRYPLLYR